MDIKLDLSWIFAVYFYLNCFTQNYLIWTVCISIFQVDKYLIWTLNLACFQTNVSYHCLRLYLCRRMVDDHFSFGDEERPKLSDLTIHLAIRNLKWNRWKNVLRDPNNEVKEGKLYVKMDETSSYVVVFLVVNFSLSLYRKIVHLPSNSVFISNYNCPKSLKKLNLPQFER